MIYDMIHLIRPIAEAKPAQFSHVPVYGRGYVLHSSLTGGLRVRFTYIHGHILLLFSEIRGSILSMRPVAMFTQNCMPVCSASSV